MRIILMFIFYLLVTAVFNCSSPAQEIFVVSDVYGIRPDGTCNELVGGHFGEFKKQNVNWDSETRTICMFAAKNEEVAVQIVIPKTGKGYHGKMSALTGPATIESNRATFSAMAWVKHVSLGFCPDLVIPLDGSINGISSFDIPISINGIPDPKNTVGIMLFEVWVSKDIPAGEYKGTVGVMEGDNEVDSLSIELTVFDFALPDMPAFALELLSYGMPSENFDAKMYVNAGSGLGVGANQIPERTKKIDYQVYKLAMDNRCFVNALPYSSQRGNPRYAYPIEGIGENARIMSYGEWDDYFSPILDGKTNKFCEPPAHFLLPFNTNYPYICESKPENQFDFLPFKAGVPDGPGKNPALREFELTYDTIADQYINHFTEKGWTKTQFEVFNNQKPNDQRNRIPWKLDEPTDLSDYKGLHYIFGTARQAFQSAQKKGVQIRNRLDIGHFNCDRFLKPGGEKTRCYKSKGYNRYDADRYLKGLVDHWVIGVTHLEAAQQTLSEYEAPMRMIMAYGTAGSSFAIGFHYGNFAGEGFKAARIGNSGKIMYKLGLDSPLKIRETDDDTFYSGSSMGFEGALPSHRLKLWRNAVNDFDYIMAAMQVDKAATTSIIKQMTKIGPSPNLEYRERSNPRAFWFTNNVEDIVRAKRKLAAIITGTDLPEIEIAGFSEKFNPCGSEDRIVGYD